MYFLFLDDLWLILIIENTVGYSKIRKPPKNFYERSFKVMLGIEYKGIKRGPAEYNVAVFKYILECKKGNLHLLLYLKYSSVIGQIQFVVVVWMCFGTTTEKVIKSSTQYYYTSFSAQCWKCSLATSFTYKNHSVWKPPKKVPFT